MIIFVVISAVIGLIPQLIKVKTDYEYQNQKVSLDRQEGYINRILYEKSFIYDAKCSNISGVLKQQQQTCVEKGITLLISDEANAALDPIAEKEMNDLICDVSGYKTTIFISHRLSTAIKADRIFYMEQGKIL